MDINKKAKEFAINIKSTEEFMKMNRCKLELQKNKNLKKQLDNYINKKNTIYSNYHIEEASKRISQLNRDYNKFFTSPIVEDYMEATREFNIMMEKLYKYIEKELLK